VSNITRPSDPPHGRGGGRLFHAQLVSGPCEQALVNPANRFLLQMHVPCAVYELGLVLDLEGVLVSSSKALFDVVEMLLLDGVLTCREIGDTKTYAPVPGLLRVSLFDRRRGREACG
jgi:hypothetical protein